MSISKYSNTQNLWTCGLYNRDFSDFIKLLTSCLGDISGLLIWPNIVTWSLKSGNFTQLQWKRKRVWGQRFALWETFNSLSLTLKIERAMGLEMCIIFGNWKWSLGDNQQENETSVLQLPRINLLTTWVNKGTGFLIDHPEESQPCWSFHLNLVRPVLRLVIYNTINLLCF